MSERRTAEDFECPACGALADEPCVGRNGNVRRPHRHRVVQLAMWQTLRRVYRSGSLADEYMQGGGNFHDQSF